MARSSPALAQRGLTLVELLVTLVIAAAAVSILGQAVWQVYRIESALADDRFRGQTLLLRTEWVRQALAGLQPGDAAGKGRMKGGETELTGITSNPIALEAGSFGTLTLRLRFDSTTGNTVLEHVMQDKLAETVQPLMQWPGDRGRFVYLKRDGTLDSQWPPPMGVQERLPAAVIVETGLPGYSTLVAAPAAMDRLQPTRREFEQL